MNTIYKECASIIKELVGYKYLYFDTEVEVKTTPHTPPFKAWAVSVSPDAVMYAMDGDEEWHKVEEDKKTDALLIGSLYQRLRLMRIQYKKAV